MNRIVKQFVSLFSGTAISQLIPLAITPVLTRLYTPHEFGVYASYIAVVTILFVLCTGRYELAIISARNKGEASKIAMSTLFISFIFNLLLIALILLFGKEILNVIGFNELYNEFILVPGSLFLMSIYQTCYFLLNKYEKYNMMSRSLIIQSFAIAIFNLIIGLYSHELGLIIGYVLGQFVSSILILISCYNNKLIYNDDLTLSEMKEVWVDYIEFPKYLIVSNLANRISLQSTVIVFTKYFNTLDVGNYSLTHRILKVPMSFLGNSISQIFRQKIDEAINKNKDITKIYLFTLTLLFIVGLPIFGVIFLFSEQLFVIFLGEQWKPAGHFAVILAPMLFAQFCIAPLSAMFLFDKNQKYDLIWQLVSIIITIPVLFYTAINYKDINISLTFYSLIYVVLYIVNMSMSFFVTRKIGGKGETKINSYRIK